MDVKSSLHRARSRFVRLIVNKEWDIKQERKEELTVLERNQSSWGFYRSLCQFRLGYLAFLVLISIIIFSFAFLMELFFCVFLPAAKEDPNYYLRSFLMLLTLPVMLVLLSYMFEESMRLFIDALSATEGGFANFRLSLAVLIHAFRHKPQMTREHTDLSNVDPYYGDNHELEMKERPRAADIEASDIGKDFDYSTFVIVDLICPIFFEVVTIIVFIISFIATFSVSDAFTAYIRAGFWIVSFYLVIWIIAHFWTCRSKRMRYMVLTYRVHRERINRELNKIQKNKWSEHFWLLDVGFRFFYCLTNTSKEDMPQSDAQSDTLSRWATFRAAVKAKNPYRRLHPNFKILLMLPCIFGGAFASFYSFYLGWPIMGCSLLLLASALRVRFPQIFGVSFFYFILAFVLIAFLFITSTMAIGTFVKGGSFDVRPPNYTDPNHSNISIAFVEKPGFNNIPQYPICYFEHQTLSIVDFVLIADAAYGSTISLQESMLRKRFNGTALSNWNVSDRSNLTSDHQQWMQIDFPDIKATVVAIRGTASAADALQDMHYWFGITIMQMANVFIPFLNQLPQEFVVHLLSLRFLKSFEPTPVYQKILDKVQILKETKPNVIIVGHSLGGAMAAMVGAKLHLPAVSFSGPGLIYSRGRFGIESEQEIRDYVLTVKPRGDIVPRVDRLGGLVQDIDCRRDNPKACHGTDTHACEFYLTCGDKRGRDWSRECKDYRSLAKKLDRNQPVDNDD
ncbi:hypothetical protein THRCLA_00078 [Thraustotheca clavata]|uniref:Fungal lipase-type domain-containing protein n=1 Tax=Thraustotheca clavata TaxID=74557 RepID=A0A1W0ACC0_9STRA|nr:hypothetical protein THRCLA_00078 [Thraustotheca clavata]